jgi:uncharacterized membrane protein YagU involved in acid resistance
MLNVVLLERKELKPLLSASARMCWLERKERMKNFNLSRAIAAGFIGTLVMTMVMMFAPAMGLPKMDIAAMLGSMFAAQPPAMGSGFWLFGFGMHLMIGVAVLSSGFALVNSYLPTSSSLVRGLFFGVGVWLMAQLIVMPMMGAGLFSSNLPRGMMMAAGSLIGHLIYGGIVGLVYGRRESEEVTAHASTLGI